MNEDRSHLVAKVPQVTLLFWIVKILATTLGETAGESVNLHCNHLFELVSSNASFMLLAVAVLEPRPQ